MAARALPHRRRPRYPSEAGAALNGTTNDRGAVEATLTYALANSRKLEFDPNSTLAINTIPSSEFNWTVGTQPALILQPTLKRIEGNGATIKLQSSTRGLIGGSMWSNYHTSHFNSAVTSEIASDIAVGALDIPLTAGGGAKFTVGDTVVFQVGEMSFDRPEPDDFFFARITAKPSADTITIDRPFTTPLTVASQTTYGKFVRKWTLFENLVVNDITLEGPTADRFESGLNIFGARNVTFNNVGGRNVGAAVCGGQYIEQLTMNNCWADTSKVTQASYGRAFALAEVRKAVLNNCRATKTLSFLGIEGNSDVTVNSPLFENTLTDGSGVPYGTAVKVFGATGRSTMTVRDATITGYGNFNLASEGSNTGETFRSGVFFEGTTRFKITAEPYSVPLEKMSGVLDMEIAGVREIYDLNRTKEWRRRVYLKNGMSLDNLFGPAGLLISADVYCSPGLAGKIGSGLSLTGLYVGRQGNNGPNSVAATSGLGYGPLSAGDEVAITVIGGNVGGAHWADRDMPLKLAVTTASGTDLDAANEFIEVICRVAPAVPFADGTIQTWTESNWLRRWEARQTYEAQFTSYDLANVVAGGTLQVDFAIADMAAGDFIESVRFANGLTGLSIRSQEAVAGNARIVFENLTGSPIDKAATNVIIEWSKPHIGT